MSSLRYKFLANARVVSITLGFIALLMVAVQGYISGEFNALDISVMVLIALNVIYMFLVKPQNPEQQAARPNQINTNGDSQEA